MSLIDPARLDAMGRLSVTTPPGAIGEVGVYRGGSAEVLRRFNPGRDLYLYDTFSGIPEATPQWDRHVVGDFSDTDIAAVRKLLPDAIFCIGVFPHTFVPVPYAFVHVDCDQYMSIKACIDTFGPHMVPGGKMWFDDYGCLPGATKAVEESNVPFEVILDKAVMRF